MTEKYIYLNGFEYTKNKIQDENAKQDFYQTPD